MNISNGHDAKKRKTGDDGGASLSGGQEGSGDGLAQALMLAMNQLLDQNRSQVASIASMQEEMKSMGGKMDRMEGEMKSLKQKCDKMELEKSVANSIVIKKLDSSHNFHRKIVSRLDDAENRQKYQEVLLKNQKWKYSAPFQDVSNNTQRILDRIKKTTCDIRYGNCGGTVHIHGGGDFLAYDAAFLPHWKEFANALEEYHYALKCLPKETVSRLVIRDVELSKRVLGLLSYALVSTHFKEISLNDNRFGRDGIKFLLDYMQRNRQLEAFELNHNIIDDQDDVNQLCEIIRDHPSIKTIQLYGCCGDGIDGHKMLRSIMTAGASKLKAIDLSSNDISTESAFIADFLATNPILEEISLTSNNLSDEDADSIASALKHNTNLRCLDVTKNDNITESGWGALRKAEFDSTSLNSAADSNHTCNILDPDDNEINGDPDTCDPYEPKALMQKKIYSVLSSGNRESSNVHHFDDVPIELLPEMLTSIQKYSNYHVGANAPPKDNRDVKTLSVVYEIMRKWDQVISVYESLSS